MSEDKNPYIELVQSDGGRPLKKLTKQGLELVATLSQFMATEEEIAEALSDEHERISVDTLHRPHNEQAFTDYKNRGQSRGKASLRSWQFAAAKNGNVTMQIWLGKNDLDQKDRVETEQGDSREINITVTAASVEDAKEER